MSKLKELIQEYERKANDYDEIQKLTSNYEEQVVTMKEKSKK